MNINITRNCSGQYLVCNRDDSATAITAISASVANSIEDLIKAVCHAAGVTPPSPVQHKFSDNLYLKAIATADAIVRRQEFYTGPRFNEVRAIKCFREEMDASNIGMSLMASKIIIDGAHAKYLNRVLAGVEKEV